MSAFADVADYFTVNISSPNTPGLRDLQDPKHLNALLTWLTAARKGIAAADNGWRPILVKLAPDLNDALLSEIVSCLMENSIDGIILTNTTLSRDGLTDLWTARENGGLSGRPIFSLSTKMLAKVYLQTKGKIPLVGVGGIDSALTALQKMEAGASLIQIYTGLVFQGPGLIGRIKKGLVREIEQSAVGSVSDIVGRRAEEWVSDTYSAQSYK